MKVYISTSSFAEYDREPLEILKAHDIAFEVNQKKRGLNEDEILAILATGQYSGLIAGVEPLTEKVLRAASGLKVISRVGTGMDSVNETVAREIGISIYRTAGVLNDAVAELTLGLTLCCLRKIASMSQQMHQQKWQKQMGQLLKGKVFGLIGAGHIGQRVSQLVRAFGAKVVYSDIHKVAMAGCKQVPLKKLLQSADIISLHVSGKQAILGPAEFLDMKSGVIIINTSRGQVIDAEALAQSLVSGKVAAAGLDVFPQEPYQGPLGQMDNVVLTPHIGSYALEARTQMELLSVKNCVKGLKKQGLLKTESGTRLKKSRSGC